MSMPMFRIQRACLSILQQFAVVFKQERGDSPDTMYKQEQHNFENRVSCGICLEPRLRMVTGKCQHRFCVHCMYDGSGTRRSGLEKCPTCQMDSAFPDNRPVIPEDMIEIQKALGVGACDQCGGEMWFRELIDHQRTCEVSLSSPPLGQKSSSRHKGTPCSRRPEGRVQKRTTRAKGGYEVKNLLDDLGSGVTTRSQGSPHCLQDLLSVKHRKHRSAGQERKCTLRK